MCIYQALEIPPRLLSLTIMELLELTTNWVKGEVLQGKIMLTIGILLLIGGIYILRSDHEILRGTLIPLGLSVLALIGYGGFQTLGRPAHIPKVTELHAENPQQAIVQEYEKATNDDRVYSTLKIVWPILIVVSVILYFVFSSEYLKGLSIGLMGLFLTILLLDTTLHYRLSFYLEGLSKLVQ